MFIGVNSAPRIRHNNRQKGDGADLVRTVCRVMHVNKAAERLLLYYTNCPSNYMVHKERTAKLTKIHISNLYQSRLELIILGLIYLEDSDYIVIPWERLHIFSLLDEKKTAKVIKGNTHYIANPLVDTPYYYSNSTINSELHLNTIDELDTPFDKHFLGLTQNQFIGLLYSYIRLTYEDGEMGFYDNILNTMYFH